MKAHKQLSACEQRFDLLSQHINKCQHVRKDMTCWQGFDMLAKLSIHKQRSDAQLSIHKQRNDPCIKAASMLPTVRTLTSSLDIPIADREGVCALFSNWKKLFFVMYSFSAANPANRRAHKGCEPSCLPMIMQKALTPGS